MKSYLVDVDKVLSGSKLLWSLYDILGCWPAHTRDRNSAFANQFLPKIMLPLLSHSRRDGCKNRPNN